MASCPASTSSVQPTGARSWAVRYRHATKPRKLTLGPFPALDLSTARARAREALQDVARGGDPASAKREQRRAARDETPDRDTVAAVVERFLARHTRPNNKKRTVQEVERTFRKHVLPAWRDRPIQDIGRRDVITLLDGIVDRGTPVAANRVLAHVRKLFNWALDRSIIEASPCVRIQAPTAEKSRDRVLSDDELRLIWKAADRVDWPFGRFVQLLLLTVQRRDEVAGMRRRETEVGRHPVDDPRRADQDRQRTRRAPLRHREVDPRSGPAAQGVGIRVHDYG